MNEPKRGPNWPFPQSTAPALSDVVDLIPIPEGEIVKVKVTGDWKPLDPEQDESRLEERQDADIKAMKNQGLGAFPTTTFTHVPKEKK